MWDCEMNREEEVSELADELYEYVQTHADDPSTAIAALLLTFYKINAEYRVEGLTREDVIKTFTLGLDLWDGRGGMN
jgi:hypothetical protein